MTEKAKCRHLIDLDGSREIVIVGKNVNGDEIIPAMCIGECECGYHFGVDATYLEQVGDFEFKCPSCGCIIDTADVFAE